MRSISEFSAPSAALAWAIEEVLASDKHTANASVLCLKFTLMFRYPLYILLLL
jgi:hypothetical protein